MGNTTEWQNSRAVLLDPSLVDPEIGLPVSGNSGVLGEICVAQMEQTGTK